VPFSPSAHLYDAIYGSVRDYPGQARKIAAWVRERKPDARSLLDIACGTGLHLAHLQCDFEVEGLDASEAMIRIAQARNPRVRFHVGDMREFDTGRRYDAVICMFSSITYCGTRESLTSTLGTFARHLELGGVCVVEPYIPAEAWIDGLLGMRSMDRVTLKIGMVDRAVRRGRQVTRDIAYAVATGDGIQLIEEHHTFGLFTTREYEVAFRSAGFDVTFDPRGFDESRGMYLAVRTSRG
jgi:SAM-dependent methyltransferase